VGRRSITTNFLLLLLSSLFVITIIFILIFFSFVLCSKYCFLLRFVVDNSAGNYENCFFGSEGVTIQLRCHNQDDNNKRRINKIESVSYYRKSDVEFASENQRSNNNNNNDKSFPIPSNCYNNNNNNYYRASKRLEELCVNKEKCNILVTNDLFEFDPYPMEEKFIIIKISC